MLCNYYKEPKNNFKENIFKNIVGFFSLNTKIEKTLSLCYNNIERRIII